MSKPRAAAAASKEAIQTCARKARGTPTWPMRRRMPRCSRVNSTHEAMPAEMVRPATPQRGAMPRQGADIAKDRGKQNTHDGESQRCPRVAQGVEAGRIQSSESGSEQADG